MSITFGVLMSFGQTSANHNEHFNIYIHISSHRRKSTKIFQHNDFQNPNRHINPFKVPALSARPATKARNPAMTL